MEQHQPNNDVLVVMVPLPLQGHLNQLLHLTRIISTRGIQVYFFGSAIHNRQAKDRVHGWEPSTISNVHFQDAQLPQITTPPPDPSNRFPPHLVPTLEATVHLREPLGALLRELASSARRVVVVHDSLMGFAAEEASFLSNAEAYSFIPCSSFSLLQAIWGFIDQSAFAESKVPKDILRVTFEDTHPKEFYGFSIRNSQYMQNTSGNILDTCEAIDGRFIDALIAAGFTKKKWAMGPFHPVTVDSPGSPPHHPCLEWLDKQPASSVIYVSFGTLTSVSDEQIAELAIGLESSEHPFIWVLRDADRGNIYEGEVRKPQLPEGFEERVKGVGMIVRDWAPQLQILAHSSTGGFMSHCGWNSCTESLCMGVPIAAWPMMFDQPGNALLITQVLEAGLMVREWARRGEVISSASIESSIRKLMVLDEGNRMRKRAKEVAIDIHRAVSDGGTSTTQLESFLAHISR
nr:glycosyltransferase [Helleborus thibetanus]